MRSVKVFYSNGQMIPTNINGTDQQISDYFKVGKAFNLGDGKGGDCMATVKRIEIYPNDAQLKIEKAVFEEINKMSHLTFEVAKSRLIKSYEDCQKAFSEDSIEYMQYAHAIAFLNK